MAKKGTAVDWELTQDSQGQAIWEVTVRNGRQQTEVKIDAISKNVISTDKDKGHDDH